MKNIQKFEDFSQVSEKDNVDIFKKQFNKIKNQNQEYNFEPVSSEFKDKDPNYDIVISKKIEIGDPNPVKKFQQWAGKYWRKKKDRYKKYEPQAKQ